MTTFSSDDFRLQAEREVVERLFKTSVLADTKMSKREQEVRNIAVTLFLSFFNADEHDEILFGPRWEDPVFMSEYLSKAEKVYTVAGDYETAMKVLGFLKIIDPVLAMQIVEKL
jgi:hypothetical protein